MDQIVKKNKKMKKIEKPTKEQAEEAVRTLLAWTGDDPTREGLIDTPKRVVKAYLELYGGYNENPQELLQRTFEDVSGYKDMVVVKDIMFNSHCEHHMVPIIGKVHVGYMPNKKVVGLSKIARVVDIFARRLQTQESMTAQIAQTIQNSLEPDGVAVIIEAEHMCMTIRGAKKHGSATVTSEFTGKYRDNKEEQLHFIAITNNGKTDSE